MRLLITINFTLLVVCALSSGVDDFLGAANLTPEEKAKFNELYEKAMKEGTLLKFLKNYTAGKSVTGGTEVGSGKTGSGNTSTRQKSGTENGQKGGSLTGDRKICFQKARKLERQANASGKTFDRKAAVVQCLKDLEIQKRHKEACEKETATTKALAQSKNLPFQEQRYLQECLKRPLPTDLPATTREPKTNVNQKCEEQYAELVKDGQTLADKLAFHDNCVKDLKVRRDCYRQYEEASKSQSDLQKKQFIDNCIKQANNKSKRDLLQPGGLTEEEKVRFNELYQKALTEGNLVEFLKSYASGKPMKNIGGNSGKTVDNEKSARKTCRDEIDKKEKESAANMQPFNAAAELKKCVKGVKARVLKKEACKNETEEARLVAESQKQAFNVEQYLASCINRPIPTEAPKPTKPAKLTDLQKCQSALKEKIADGDLKNMDEKQFIEKCLMIKKMRDQCTKELKANKKKVQRQEVRKCVEKKMAAQETTMALTRPTTTASQATRPVTQAPTRSTTSMPTRLSTRLSTHASIRPTPK